MPEFLFDADSMIPDELRSSATKNEAGKFVLNLVPKAKLDEFRESNIKVSKERDELLGKYGKVSQLVGEDADAFAKELAELRSTHTQVADGKLKKSEDIEKTLTERTAAMRKSFEDQSQNASKENALIKADNEALKGEIKKINIDRAITGAVLNGKAGALPEALPHILSEAYKVFVVEPNGDIIPKNGDAIIYGADGSSPMTSDEWLLKLSEKSSYLFKPSAGGGATGAKDTNTGGMSAAEFAKLKPQQKLELANRAR
jgi:hypothetical protein